MKKTIIISAIGILSVISTQTHASLVEMDLLALGCPTYHDFGIPQWSYDFDLGVQFSSIDHVFMDWSGEITGGLAKHIDGNPEPFSFSIAIKATLGEYPDYRYAEHWGGAMTYPDPDSFDELTEFIEGIMPWSNLYDGKEKIKINTESYIMSGVVYLELGNIKLDKANLVIDGTIIPEPSSFMIICLGGLILKIRRRK